MKPIFKISLAVLAFAPLVALAQPPQKQAPASFESGGVTIRNAAGGTTTYDDARGLARLTKDVVVVQKNENVRIFAQEATYDRIRNFANASGQLRVETRDSTIRGKNLFADFNARRATITGDVVITSHGKNDGVISGLRAEAQKKPIKVLCNRVDWEYDIKQATATGNISILQGPNRGTCDSIVYDETRNIINLKGNVRFGDNKKRVLVGRDITVYLDEGKIISNSGGTSVIIPPGDFDNNQSPARTPRPKNVTRFDPAPTLPPLDEVTGPPPIAAPKARATATEEPLPTPRPDDPEPVETPEAEAAAPGK